LVFAYDWLASSRRGLTSVSLDSALYSTPGGVEGVADYPGRRRWDHLKLPHSGNPIIVRERA
jgi:hypothetical protein